MRLFVSILCFVSLVFSQSFPQQLTLDQVLQRTSAYVKSYTKQLGGVIGNETYVQTVSWSALPGSITRASTPAGNRQRVTRSDFRTMPIGDEWFGMRRVREVDGIEIDPRFWGRLGEAFDLSTQQGRREMQKSLASENARFNLDDFFLSNVPTFPLEFFRPSDIGIYDFQKTGEDALEGQPVWKIDAVLKARQSAVVPLTGQFWIEPESGRVLRGVVDVQSPDPRVIPSLHLDVRFKVDSVLGMLVPASMDQQFDGSLFEDRNVKTHAEYSDFHQFGADVRLGGSVPEPASRADLTSIGRNTYSIKVDVPVVTVEAWVTKTNVPVLDLKAEDFIVTENNVRQMITNFSPVETPCDVLLLFDRSGSTIREMPLMKRAAEGLISQLRPQDRVGLASFGNTLRMVTKWTDSREQIISSFSRLAEGSFGTEFYRGLQHSLTSELLPVQGRRRILVLLTDGRDNGVMKVIASRRRLSDSEPEFTQALDSVRREHVPIYVVALNTDRNPMPGNLRDDEYVQLQQLAPRTTLPQEYLKLIRSRLVEIADVSGGHILFPKKLEDIIPLYRQIGEEIGTAYSIGYASTISPENRGYRGIKVTARDSSLRIVQSREGYLLP